MMLIKDRDGVEHEAKIGQLVLGQDYYQQIIGRIRDFRKCHCGQCQPKAIVYIDIWQDSMSFNADQLTLITDEPAVIGDDKAPILYRRRNLNGNIDRLCLKCRNDRMLYNAVSELVGILNSHYRPDQEHFWFWQSVAESADDPRKISYAPTPELYDNDTRRRKCGVKKFLSGPAREHGLVIDDATIEAISNLVGQTFPANRDYSFEIVEGDDIRKAYAEASFGSCMHNNAKDYPRTAYVNWYGENPDSVKLIRILMGGQFVGRALLWNTIEGKRVVDRIYPSDNGPQIPALIKYAEQQGWDYKTEQTYYDGYLKSGNDYTVRMKRASSGKYPYCDTFKYTDDDPETEDELIVSTSGGEFKFVDTEGDYEGHSSRCICEDCGCRMNEDEAHHPDCADGPYCENCYNNNFVYLDYRHNGRYVERTVWREDAAECECCGEMRLSSHLEDVDEKLWCSRCVENNAFVCADCDTLLPNEVISEYEYACLCEACYQQRLEDEEAGRQRREAEAAAEAARQQPVLTWLDVYYSRLSWAELVTASWNEVRDSRPYDKAGGS